MTLYGYARVSVREPEDKNLDLQVERLVRAGCSLGNIRAEEASGARNDRGGLLELLDLWSRGTPAAGVARGQAGLRGVDRHVDGQAALSHGRTGAQDDQVGPLQPAEAPGHIPDQLTQNFYAFSLPIVAKAWAWGEALIRNHGAALAA